MLLKIILLLAFYIGMLIFQKSRKNQFCFMYGIFWIVWTDGLFLRCTHTCFLSSKVQSPYAETLESRRSALLDDFEEEEEDKEDAHSLTLYSEYMTSWFAFPIIQMLHSTNCFHIFRFVVGSWIPYLLLENTVCHFFTIGSCCKIAKCVNCGPLNFWGSSFML